jgi:hypothetical protein
MMVRWDIVPDQATLIQCQQEMNAQLKELDSRMRKEEEA